MRMPFIGPSQEEVVVIAADLIARFGLRAQDEASYLEDVAAEMRSARNRNLYRRAAREHRAKFRRGADSVENKARVKGGEIDIVGAPALRVGPYPGRLRRTATCRGDQDRAGMPYPLAPSNLQRCADWLGHLEAKRF